MKLLFHSVCFLQLRLQLFLFLFNLKCFHANGFARRLLPDIGVKISIAEPVRRRDAKPARKRPRLQLSLVAQREERGEAA